MIHRNLLLFRGARYLWWSLLLIVISAVLFGSQGQLRSGSTWQGYVLGTLGALLVGWLALLAIRKRRYSSTLGTVQGWTSAHVYLGTALLVVATLHCGLQFGWNVHTLAYVLMCLVIGSGLVGLAMYLQHPRRLAENRQGGARAQMFGELFELDQQAKAVARQCAPPIEIAVTSSIERTAIGGGVAAQLLGRDGSAFLRSDGNASALLTNVDQHAVIEFVAEQIPRASKGVEAENLQQLVMLLCRRQVVLRRIRLDLRLQGWMKFWLYFHVPTTAALLVALAAHIVTTFTYR